MVRGMSETLREKVARVLRDRVKIVPYDPAWPGMFEAERRHLLGCLPPGLAVRVEHYGSTSVPGLAAKPVVDMLVETPDLERARMEVPAVLEPQGYDCFWRPTAGDDVPPFYVWCIKRDEAGRRTHHIHIVEAHFETWEGLTFRDMLRAAPALAREYEALKLGLARRCPDDRVAYTEGKGEFIRAALARVNSGETAPGYCPDAMELNTQGETAAPAEQRHGAGRG